MVCSLEININAVNITQCLKQGNLKGLIAKSLKIKRKILFPHRPAMTLAEKNDFLVIKDLLQFGFVKY